MRKCVKCGIEKELHDFRKNGKWFKHTCKECLNAPLRTGKEHTGRFKKGDKPSESTQFKKGQTAHNKGKKLSSEEIERMKESYQKRKPRPDRGGKGRHTTKYREWQTAIKERDNNECKHCRSKEDIHCHHIIAWVDNENLRFDVENGMLLCNSCHMAHEFKERQKKGISTEFKKGSVPWNKGLLGYNAGKRKPHSEETKRKISETKRLKNALHTCLID